MELKDRLDILSFIASKTDSRGIAKTPKDPEVTIDSFSCGDSAECLNEITPLSNIISLGTVEQNKTMTK